MKTITAKIIILLVVFLVSGYAQHKSFTVRVKNPNEFAVKDGYFTLRLESVQDNFIIAEGDNYLPYQITSAESGGICVGVTADFKPNEEKTLVITYDSGLRKAKFKSRTYAELAMKPVDSYYEGKFRGNTFFNVTDIKVPAVHTDHDALFKYEGPGWESEKVGYRFYLDWRNAIDIFGKKKDQLILAGVGVHDTVAQDDSYHSMQEWGMDIFKVGNSLGIGSFGMMVDGKVVMVSKTESIYFEIKENGPLKSEIKTTYFEWNTGKQNFNLESRLSITAGSRMTKNEINISGDPQNIVTGLAKFPGTYFFKGDGKEEWSYIALYGNQTLVSENDKLGIAVFFRKSKLIEFAEDSLSYIVKLKPEKGKIDYYFCAAWEQEQNGIKNLDEFKNYLNETQSLLNNPLIVVRN